MVPLLSIDQAILSPAFARNSGRRRHAYSFFTILNIVKRAHGRCQSAAAKRATGGFGHLEIDAAHRFFEQLLVHVHSFLTSSRKVALSL